MPLLPFAPAPASGGAFPLAVTAPAAGTIEYESNVTGDTQERFTISADGALKWGPGNAPTNISLAQDELGDLIVTASSRIFLRGSTGLILEDSPVSQVVAQSPLLMNLSLTTLSGTTAGSLGWTMPLQGSVWKRFVGIFSGYENTTGVAQTVAYPTAFTSLAAISFLSAAGTVQSSAASTITGAGLATSLTTLTLPNTMTAVYTGLIIVEGI